MEKRWGLFLMTAWMLLWLHGAGEAVLSVDGSAEITEEPRYLALTFDDGPRPGTTDRLLDGLRERGASATFFLVGEQAALYPDLVQRMRQEGHQVGNHTWSHVRLEGELSKAMQEIENTQLLLQNLLGEGAYWLRPPYGLIDPGIASQVKVPMVKWSVDPRDWESRNAEVVFQALREETKTNDILLLHDIYEPSVEAALRLVDELQGEGYLFVTVEELLRLNGVEPQVGVMYRTGK